MNYILKLISLLLILGLCLCDVYMHNPRGSNNRNCGTGEQRRNGNLLCDTENNGKGGYACPRAMGGPDVKTPKMFYYVGSMLPIEFTAQHGCLGNNNDKIRNNCQIVLQYMCGAHVRYGIPQSSGDSATTRIPDNTASELNYRYSMHENLAYYKKCQVRERNKGLWTADQKLRNDARYTRQNNNGGRFGLECPEEAHYYPYWHPTPWKDIAVLTDDLSMCPYYQAESQNVKDKGECRTPYYNNQEQCNKVSEWISTGKHNIAAPQCLSGKLSRQNHLGNLKGGVETARYWWKIPDDVNESCVLRIRYNISSSDVPFNLDSNNNGKEVSKVTQDPYVKINGVYFQLAADTNQVGRTFQDRSYTFAIRPRPAGIPKDHPIYNLNVRGKRGNIVQTYPAVEYDFTPNYLEVNQGDCIHFQWTGSDYNPRRNPNNGRGGSNRSDRSNIVEMKDKKSVFPSVGDTLSGSMFSKAEDLDKMAFIGQDKSKCLTKEQLEKKGKNKETDPGNCAKLNGAKHPYFNGGPVQMRKVGTFHYMSTRNNNFSNRDQRGTIVVKPASFTPLDTSDPQMLVNAKQRKDAELAAEKQRRDEWAVKAAKQKVVEEKIKKTDRDLYNHKRHLERYQAMDQSKSWIKSRTQSYQDKVNQLQTLLASQRQELIALFQ